MTANFENQHVTSGPVSGYGHFTAGGTEYRIVNPRTPRPWVNVIANPRVGLAVSQTGSGFSWIDNSQLGTLTNWQQDFAQDSSGKFLYLRDADTGETWSLSPAPTWAPLDRFECRHGIGYTTFRTEYRGIAATWTLFVHADEPVEFWRVSLENLGDRPRRLQLCAYLEWCCGVSPAPRREFHKLFIETRFAPEMRAVFATNHMWDVPNARWGHWNSDFPYIAGFACTEPVDAALGDKGAFLGRCGALRAPAALAEAEWWPSFGRHDDPIAAMRSEFEVPPKGARELGYVLATGRTAEETAGLVARHANVKVMDGALGEVRAAWRSRFAAHRVRTPEPTLDYLANDWIRYQAISSRLWGRAGYYQQSGAFGFRDQLQDSQVWLTIDPERCREQIRLHAAHQFADGSVYHWWHPLSEMGHVTKMTDDLLWLSFVIANYVRETGRLDVLSDEAPYLDDVRPHALLDHVERAFARVFRRTGPRGLPYIGAGDWNDGLSAMGLEERGESVWLAEFLAGLLAEWGEIYARIGEAGKSADFARRRAALVAAINEIAWDGAWYTHGTLADGTVIGSQRNRRGRIFLNAQTWAVLNDVAPADRAARCMESVKEHLVSPAGALLLAPAYDEPVQEIGYITRYAPGLRENGGVYTHAATWAIAAAAKMRDHDLVGRLLTAINPALKDPERYWAEPYVLPGNVDGPDSPHHGRGGWTWYTGSAAWLHRIVTHWVLGVRPEWDALRFDPVLPGGWTAASLTRPWRGATYSIRIERSAAAADAQARVWLDGVLQADNTIAPPSGPGEHHDVVVRCR